LVSPPVDYDHDATTKDAIAYFGERGPKRDFSPEHKAASEAAQTALRAVLSAKSNPSAAPAAKSAVQAAVRLLDENGRRGETRLVIDLAKDSGVFQKPYDFSTHRLPEHIRTFYRTVPPSKQTASEMMASMPGVQRLNR
jgi:guanyl-specific ribonuclease Sa